MWVLSSLKFINFPIALLLEYANCDYPFGQQCYNIWKTEEVYSPRFYVSAILPTMKLNRKIQGYLDHAV